MRKTGVLCRVLLAAGMCVVGVTDAYGGSTWREVRSPHFTVVTDGSSKDGRNVANEFEQMRHVFALRFQREEETGAPLTIVAIREPADLQILGPGFWKERDRVAGQFFSGWERQYALVRLDSFGDDNQVVVFHEYTHAVMHANLHWLPTWLDEGLAEFYAYTRFQGDRIYIGAPSVRLPSLRQEASIPIKEMLQATGATYARDSRREDVFYAESWALVHYLTFSKEMGQGAKLAKFLNLSEGGLAQNEAFQQVFGDFKAFDSGFSQYLSSMALKAAVLPPDRGLDQKTFEEHVLSEAETDYNLGSFAGVRDRATGRALLQKAVAAGPELAGAHEELGYLDFDLGLDDEAVAEWKKALSLDPKRYRSQFALAMMQQPTGQMSPGQIKREQLAIQQVTEMAPRFAPAFAVLALLDWRLSMMQQAYKDAQQAEKLQPWRAGYRLLVGHILLAGHQPAEAAKYARLVASRWTAADHNEAVDLWNQLPAAAKNDGPPMTLDVDPQAKVVRGTIVSTACPEKKGEYFSLTLQPDGGGPAVQMTAEGGFQSGFSDTLWWGEDHFTMCHHVVGLRALTATKPGGKLETFEIRDVLPSDTQGAVPAPVPAGAAPTAAAAAKHP